MFYEVHLSRCFCSHPSRCFVVCILRGALLCASFKMLCCARRKNISRILRVRELMPSKVTSVRVVFFGEKCLPPFLTARCLRVTGVGGSSGDKGSLLSIGLREVVCSLTRQRAQILCFGKNISPWLLFRGVVFFFVFASVGSNDGCRRFR